MKRILNAFLLCLGAIGPAAWASPITMTVSGVSSFAATSLSPTFVPGQNWVATFSFDPSSDPVGGLYGASDFSLSIGGESFTGSNGAIYVRNDFSYNLGDIEDYWYANFDNLNGRTQGGDTARFGIVFSERNADPTFLASSALIAPSLSKFTFAFMQYDDTFSAVYLQARDLAFSSQVPEPGTLSLIGLALAGFAVTRRRTNFASSR